MNKFFSKPKSAGFSFFPLQKIILSFIILISAGAVLLMIPVSTVNGISLIDAVFTSTSAVCVTGLIVLDTAKDFTLFGKSVILLLIQFGGFGIMTFSMGIISFLGRGLSVKWTAAIQGMYSDSGKMPVRKILVKVIKYTLIIESITAVVLFSQFSKQFPLFKAVSYSVFLSISAFCNAGFSVFTDSLMSYRANYIINAAVIAAVTAGGLGFIVLNEISLLIKELFLKGRVDSKLSVHTKIVLITSGILIISGTLLFYVLERGTILAGCNTLESLVISVFQSVTCRTAGFNTVDISALRQSTLVMMMVLMFIGGSPGSIAGGIKTTSIAVIFLTVFSKLNNKKNVSVFGRTLSNGTIDRSIILFISSVTVIFLSVFLILSISSFDSRHSMISVLFESVSAFGTVGLSTGITPLFGSFHKAVIIAIMFTGRVGLLTFIIGLTSRKSTYTIEYPVEHIMIG